VKSTAKQVLATLRAEKGYETLDICVRTINNLLNRNGYTLKKVQKTLPQKRIPETDAIFNNIAAHRAAEPIGVLKLSIDAKDNVAVGPSSRNGYSRTLSAVKAADKDFEQTATLIPFGIVEIASGQATVVVGNSAETSDFVGDALATWYEIKKADMIDKGIHTLEIYLDNGPSVASKRTQFINRIIEFSCISGLNVHLLYYPPYHSKYNPIERVWAAVEQYWNGTILDSVDKVIDTLGNVSWKQQKINAIFIDKHYEKKVTLSHKEMKLRKPFLFPNTEIPKWDVLIKYNHEMGSLFFS
jgi:transposase